jgi:CxxC motif-containing protein
MTAEVRPEGAVIVSGNQCARGAQYAKDELVNPRRVITATCRTGSATHPRLPVRSTKPCPRDLIEVVLSKISAMSVALPVAEGDLLGSFEGVGVVATRSLRE